MIIYVFFSLLFYKLIPFQLWKPNNTHITDESALVTLNIRKALQEAVNMEIVVSNFFTCTVLYILHYNRCLTVMTEQRNRECKYDRCPMCVHMDP